jgi:IMP dehydrogenase
MVKKPKVKDYMSREVDSIPEHFTVKEAIDKVIHSEHQDFPVTRNGNLVGFISPKDLLENYLHPEKSIKEIYEKNVVVAHPDLSINDAARVMFRYGYRKLPVVDDSGKMIGIITNTDIIRSHIERATPRKVEFVKNLLEEKYHVRIEMKEYNVPLDKLHPTQWRIHEDELKGREYELKKGLAEPLVVIKRKTYFVLVDGHHRVIAAKRLGLKELDSYVLELDRDVELKMEKDARDKGILTLDDIKIIDDAQHPLVEITTRLFKDRERK